MPDFVHNLDLYVSPFVEAAKFPGAIASADSLLNAWNLATGTLSTGIGASDTTLQLNSGQGSNFFEFDFVVTLDNEIILISQRSGDVFTVAPGGRGFERTTAASHLAGAAVQSLITAKSHNQDAAEINAVETALGTSLRNVAVVDPTVVPTDGQPLLWSSSESKYVPGDPLVQGIQAEGTTASTVKPIIIAGKDGSGNLKVFVLDSLGNLGVLPAVASFKFRGFTEGNLVSLNTNLQGALRVRLDGTDSTGVILVANRYNQLELNFSQAFDATQITNTASGSGAATQGSGTSTYATGTAATGEAKGVSVASLLYRPGHEWFAFFSASFTPPTDATNTNFQHIGIYSATDGFYIGWDKTTFNFTQLQNSVTTVVARASWNGDPCDGSANSSFTSGGSPVALNFAKLNVFRIRGTWFGASVVILEVLAPDDVWVRLHTLRFPNTLTSPYTFSTAYNMQIDVKKTSSDSTNLQIVCPCMALGTNDPTQRIADTLSDNSLAELTRSVIAGKNPSGTYQNVGVDTLGALDISTVTAETGAAISAAWTNVTAGNTALVASVPGFSNATFSFVLSGGVIASGVIQFECSPDGITWFPLSVEPVSGFSSLISSYSLTGASNIWQAYIGGFKQVRIRLSTAITNSSGAPIATVWIRPSVSSTQESGLVFQPTGSNLHVTVDSPLPALAAGAQIIGQIKLVDGPGSVNQAMIKAASTAAIATDTSLVVQLSPNQPALAAPLNVQTKTALTPSAPAAASVGVASGSAVAANSSRKGLVLINTSANYISLGFGANAAVLYSGITLNPNGGTFVMDEFTFTTLAVNAIASGTSSNLAIQEMA